MSYLLTEKLANTIIIYLIIKKLSTPFKEWDAYELGIIDEDGKKIKEPITFKERDAWTVFDRFVANLKKVMSKFVGKSRFAAVATAAFLLKDSKEVVLVKKDLLRENISLSAIDQIQILNISTALDLDGLHPFINPENEPVFKFMMEKHLPMFEELDENGKLDFLKGELLNE